MFVKTCDVIQVSVRTGSSAECGCRYQVHDSILIRGLKTQIWTLVLQHRNMHAGSVFTVSDEHIYMVETC
jgi:hypothetical protein